MDFKACGNIAVPFHCTVAERGDIVVFTKLGPLCPTQTCREAPKLRLEEEPRRRASLRPPLGTWGPWSPPCRCAPSQDSTRSPGSEHNHRRIAFHGRHSTPARLFKRTRCALYLIVWSLFGQTPGVNHRQRLKEHTLTVMATFSIKTRLEVIHILSTE